MAGPQGQNQLIDFLRALRKRRWQVVVPALLVATLGGAFAVIVPKKFKLSTRIEINQTRLSDPQEKNPQEAAVRREAPSAREHIVHYNRIKEIIERNPAQWPDYVRAANELERQLFIKDIEKNLSASPTDRNSKSGTIFVDISYQDADKARAAKFLDDLAASWLLEVFETDRATLTLQREELRGIVDDLQKGLEQVEGKFYTLAAQLEQDPSELLSPGSQKREAASDWTFTTLAKTKTELDQVQTKLSTAEFELGLARKRFQAEPEKQPQAVPVAEVSKAEEIQKRKTKLDALGLEIARYRPSNSLYKKLAGEIETLKAELDELEDSEQPESERVREVDNPRKHEYELAVRTQEDLVSSLGRQREYLQGRLEELEEDSRARNEQKQDLETLRNQLTEAQTAVNDKNRDLRATDQALRMLDSSPKPWKIAQPPVAASASVQPNPWLIAVASVIAGLALGVGLAVVSEYARSSYRTVSDLATVMSVPVLGAIETIVTRRERRRQQASRAVAGVSTAVIVGCIGWITWMWADSPERLPVEVQDAIERLRSALK